MKLARLQKHDLYHVQCLRIRARIQPQSIPLIVRAAT